MIDTHAHLDFKDFDEDREKVISRFFENGGKAIVNIGVDFARSRKSVEIAKSHEGVFASVGFHPECFAKHIACDMKHDWTDELKKLAKHKKVVAIGEVGLDYFRIGEARESGEIRERQKRGFLAQIEIARELGLPVVVHCRDAWEDLFEIVKSKCQNPNVKQNPKSKIQKDEKIPDTKFVLHCYSGNQGDTKKFLDLPNVYFSFSANITYPKPSERAKQFEWVIEKIPLDRIMLDSDAPFLAPQVFRGKRNEPAYVRHIARKIAEIKQISEKEVEKATDENAKKFFGIGRLEKTKKSEG